MQLLKKEAGAPQATGRPVGGAGEVEREAEGMAAEEVADAGYAGLVADHAVHLRTVQHLSCGCLSGLPGLRYCRQSAALDSTTLHPPARRSRRRRALLASLIKRTGILVIGYVLTNKFTTGRAYAYSTLRSIICPGGKQNMQSRVVMDIGPSAFSPSNLILLYF